MTLDEIRAIIADENRRPEVNAAQKVVNEYKLHLYEHLMRSRAQYEPGTVLDPHLDRVEKGKTYTPNSLLFK